MFKLVKIVNSGTNVPEPENFPCNGTIEAPVGSALTLDNTGNFLYTGEVFEKPFCILAEDLKKGAASALCYRITPDMVFEVPVYGDPLALHNGAGVSLHYESTLGLCGVSDSTETRIATVYDTNGAKNPGDKILVYFI